MISHGRILNSNKVWLPRILRSPLRRLITHSFNSMLLCRVIRILAKVLATRRVDKEKDSIPYVLAYANASNRQTLGLGSGQVYGRVSDSLIRAAHHLLEILTLRLST
jgi:hypothetical protein